MRNVSLQRRMFLTMHESLRGKSAKKEIVPASKGHLSWRPNAVGTPAEKTGVPVTIGAALHGLFGNDDIQYEPNRTRRIEVHPGGRY